jgi:hypothetical protein
MKAMVLSHISRQAIEGDSDRTTPAGSKAFHNQYLTGKTQTVG